MIQNSRSPVVKSKISSSSGRTMSVENRTLAWTATMSSFPYFTMRAPSAAARGCPRNITETPASAASIRTKRPRATFEECDFIGIPPLLGKRSVLGVSIVEEPRDRLKQHHQEGKESGDHEKGKHRADSETLGPRH